jgi:hypothetical protein
VFIAFARESTPFSRVANHGGGDLTALEHDA